MHSQLRALPGQLLDAYSRARASTVQSTMLLLGQLSTGILSLLSAAVATSAVAAAAHSTSQT
jgi:hypothetical protein